MSLLDDIKDLPSSKWGSILAADEVRPIKSASMKSRAFIFDSDASRRLGEFITKCPDLITEQHQFALPPYDNTYIEVDLEAVHGAMPFPKTLLSNRDHRIGFLHDETGRIHVVVNSFNEPQGVVTPFYYRDYLHRPNLQQNMTRWPPNADTTVSNQMLYLGSSFSSLTPSQRQLFSDRFGMSHCGKPGLMLNDMHGFDESAAGELRIYVAALLMLYQKQHITVTDRPYERRISKGKQRVYMAHSTVTIHLSGEDEIRKAFHTGDRGPVRRHEVRAHYAHRGGLKSCNHNWILIEGVKNNRWNCPICDRHRWLRKSHLRGDGSKGFVTKDYKVKV